MAIVGCWYVVVEISQQLGRLVDGSFLVSGTSANYLWMRTIRHEYYPRLDLGATKGFRCERPARTGFRDQQSHCKQCPVISFPFSPLFWPKMSLDAEQRLDTMASSHHEEESNNSTHDTPATTAITKGLHEMEQTQDVDVRAKNEDVLLSSPSTATNTDDNTEKVSLIKSMENEESDVDVELLGGEDGVEGGEEWITVEQAMDRLGAGPFQIKILIASGLCFAADAMQVILLSFLTLVLKEEWSLSNAKTESITSCLFAGSMLGTLVLGPAADAYGRRPIFLMSAIIISVFGFATSFSHNYTVFVFLLFWVGFGVGGLVVPFDLLAEFLPSKGRGKILLSIEVSAHTQCIPFTFSPVLFLSQCIFLGSISGRLDVSMSSA